MTSTRTSLLVALTVSLLLGTCMLFIDGTSPPVAAAAGTSRYVAIAPARLADTRSGSPIAAETTRSFQITGSLVPAEATAVMLNVTATRSQANGYLQVFPTGRAEVGSSSTLNLDFAGQTIPNAAFAPIGDGGKVTVYTTFRTDVLIDVFGYFVPAENATAGRLVPVTPTRILDTRNNIGYTRDAPGTGGAVTDGQTVTLQVSGRGGVPVSGASAVVMNVTVASPTTAGFVQVAPTPVPKGAFSNLNPEPGSTIANLVVVPLGSGGQVDLYTELYDAGSLDLLADVVGYFTDASAESGSAGLFVPITPTRNTDTRLPPPQPEVGDGAVLNVDVSALAPGASAIAGNLTSTGGSAGGYLQLGPSPVSPASTSSLNTSYDGQTIANAVVSPVATGGAAQVYSYGSTHVLLDVTGWFTGAAVSTTGPTALQQLERLGTTAGAPAVPFDRVEWFPDWADADGDCQNTRHEVLIIEADAALTLSANRCSVISGVWLDPYTGATITSSSDVDVDHLVPLPDAHQSGGWAWSTEQKQAYANDLDHPETLIAVDDDANTAKGEKSPDEWMPPNTSYHCTYATEWVRIKSTWSLTVTSDERNALQAILATC
jgi:hypothetical protein